MGLAPPAIRFLVREHQRSPLSGPVLTLGRQNILASWKTLCCLFEDQGTTAAHKPESRRPTDRELFQMLGKLDVFALDVLDEENPDYIWDLNKPINDELRGRFGVIIDGGTLEYVFDVRTALANVTDMLRIGGRVIHMSPASNYLEHGFYQFSATLYSDYYAVNNFEDIQCYIFEHDIERDDSGHGEWDVWRWNPRRPFCRLQSNRQLGVICTATKTPASTSHVIPQQGVYDRSLSNGTGVASNTRASTEATRAVAKRLPYQWRRLLKRALGRDYARKPWGLQKLGRY